MTIPERLRKMRAERKISMKFCAESSGIPYNTYQKYEYGEREISITAIQKLANFYGVSTDYLLGRETDFKPDPIVQLSKAETEEDFLKKYFMLDPELRAKVREKMQEALKQQELKDDDEYIIQTTTIGAEVDRIESEQKQKARELADARAKKNVV